MLMVFLVVATMLLASPADKWRQVADEHISFAQGLAGEHARFGPDFYDALIKGNIAGCKPIEHRLAALDAAQAREVVLYCDHFCRPWADTWAEAVWPCEKKHPPAWCDDSNLAAAHFKLEPFFSALAAAVRNTHDPLVRYNIMAVIAVRLSAKVIDDHPHDLIDKWVSVVASEYLREAAAEDAIAIGRMLEGSTIGLTPRTASEFASYVKRTDALTEEQRRALEGLRRASG